MNTLKTIAAEFTTARENYLQKFDDNDRNEFARYFDIETAWFNSLLIENTKIRACEPLSLRKVLANIVTSGLTLSPAMREAYVVPRAGKATLDISYMGLIKLLTDAGTISSVEAYVIYENDEYEYELGLNRKFRHVPVFKDRGAMIAVYAIARIRGGEPQIEILTADDVEAVKAVSPSHNDPSSPWQNFPAEMWRKSAVKRLFKYLPKGKMSDELIAALSIEYQNDRTLITMSDVDKETRNEIFAEVTPVEDVSAEIVEPVKETPAEKTKPVKASKKVNKPSVKQEPVAPSKDKTPEFEVTSKDFAPPVKPTNGKAVQLADDNGQIFDTDLTDILKKL